MIEVECGCGKTFEVDDAYAGKAARCPACKKPAQVQSGSVFKPRGRAAVPMTATSTQSSVQSRAGLSVWILWMVAAFSLLIFMGAPFIEASGSAQRHLKYTAFLASGDPVGAAKAQRDFERETQELANNARTAIITFTVSVAGLACSKR